MSRRHPKIYRTRHYCGFVLNEKKHYLVLPDGEVLFFPKTEIDILAILFSEPHRIHWRDDLTESALTVSPLKGSRSLDVHVSRIRKKMGEHGKIILSVRGKGYRLNPSLEEKKRGL